VEGFSRQFLGGQLAAVGGNAWFGWWDIALLLPGAKVKGTISVLWILDPLDDLCHGYKVDIIVLLKSLINPEEEGIQDVEVVIQPCSMEEESERSTVLIVVTVEVVVQESVKLFTILDVVA